MILGNRRQLDRWKSEQGMHASSPWSAIEGFAESLELLYEQNGYSLTDIGAVWGLSRERVRQLFDQFGIPHERRSYSAACVRMWDPEQNRFVIATPQEYQERSRELRRELSDEQKSDRHARLVSELRAFGEELGRTPGLEEFCERMGLTPPALAAQVGRRIRDGEWTLTFREAFDQLWAEAGFTDRRTLSTSGDGRWNRIWSDQQLEDLRRYREDNDLSYLEMSRLVGGSAGALWSMLNRNRGEQPTTEELEVHPSETGPRRNGKGASAKGKTSDSGPSDAPLSGSSPKGEASR